MQVSVIILSHNKSSKLTFNVIIDPVTNELSSLVVVLLYLSCSGDEECGT